jgi:hypothetical protein
MKEHIKMKSTEKNGGNRSGIDRRQYSYTAYIPERRSGKDQRINKNMKIRSVIKSRKRSSDN